MKHESRLKTLKMYRRLGTLDIFALRRRVRVHYRDGGRVDKSVEGEVARNEPTS